ncbi:MAG TPA: mannosyltransferase family protein [Candidatus Baltobacteraceae bacterium]
MSAQATLGERTARVESRFLEAIRACGILPTAIVVAGGLALGFLLWYEAIVRGHVADGFLDVGLAAGLVLGVLVALTSWYFYGVYFARRCAVGVVTAMRWDSLSWSVPLLLVVGLMQPFFAISTGRITAITFGLWGLAKLLIAARFNQTVREVSMIFIVTRLPIIAIAELAYVLIGQRAGQHISESTNPLLAVWGRWDAVHYIDIARRGYYGTDMAFFPLYPMLIHFVTKFVEDYLVAGVLISNVAFFFGLLYCYKLVEHQYNRSVAHRTIFYISIFPTAVFFSAVYTESLFFALTVSSFYYIREHRWLTAGVLGALASLTRAEGILLIIPYLLEVFASSNTSWRHVFATRWRTVRIMIGAALMPLGLSLYMMWLWVLRGDPLYFSHVQSHWDRKLAWPWASVIHAVKLIRKGQPTTVATQSLELAFTILMVVILFASFKRLRLSYWSYMALSILVPMSTSSLMSMPRFALVLFPMFVMLGLWGGRPAINSTIVALSLPLLGLFTVLFANWYWVA